MSPVGSSPGASALVMSRKSLVSGRRAPARRIVLFGDSAVSQQQQQQQPSSAEGRTAGGLGVPLRNPSERKRGSDEARGISSVLPQPQQMPQPPREEDVASAKLGVNSFFAGAAVVPRAEGAALDDGADSAVQATGNVETMNTATLGLASLSDGDAAAAATAGGLRRGFPFPAMPATVVSSTTGVRFGGSGWNPRWPGNVQHNSGSNYTDTDVGVSPSSPQSHPSHHASGATGAPFHDRLSAAPTVPSFAFPANPTPASAALIPGAIGKDDVVDTDNGAGDNVEWKAPEGVTGTFSLGSSGKDAGVSTRRRRLRMRVGG